MAVNSIQGIDQFINSPVKATQTSTSENTLSFGDYLKDALQKVSDLGIESERLSNEFAAGNTDNIHEVMIAAEKADIALQFAMQIRSKILDAYTEIMRMQI